MHCVFAVFMKDKFNRQYLVPFKVLGSRVGRKCCTETSAL